MRDALPRILIVTAASRPARLDGGLMRALRARFSCDRPALVDETRIFAHLVVADARATGLTMVVATIYGFLEITD